MTTSKPTLNRSEFENIVRSATGIGAPEPPRLSPAVLANNEGVTLQADGKLDDAEQAFRSAIALDPALAQAHANLGYLLERRGRLDDALSALEQAQRFDPNDVVLRRKLRGLLAQKAPPWHFGMMNDTPRNDAFEAALVRAVRPDSLVLDIGAGSGLLSMFAARAGAREIYACEMEPRIAAKCVEIVARNGFAGRIHVIPKHSKDLVVGRDIPRPADVIVSETLSSGFLDEGIVLTMADVRARLAAPGAAIIPASGDMQVALLAGDTIEKLHFAGTVSGFDLSPFNAFAMPRTDIIVDVLSHTLLSDAVTAFRFDFRVPGPRTESRKLSLRVTRPGRAFGLVQWLRIQLADGVVYENAPGRPEAACGWTHVVHLFPEPVMLSPGQTVLFDTSHNSLRATFDMVGIS
jgi:hypothetical protein